MPQASVIEALLRQLRQWWRKWATRRRGPARKDTSTTAPAALVNKQEASPAAPSPSLHAPLLACVSVVIPALNEAARIASVVRHALSDPATAEVIVIDDSSIDDTAALARAAGAQVVTSSMLGKGASMQDGVGLVHFALVAFLDGDLAGLQDGLITQLCRPLARGQADFVKARFGRSGGRVTELTAKPMLKVFFPELAHFKQPLGGIIAARTALLKALPFEDGYGVDIGLLIDAHRAGARLAEVDIGSLDNDSQPLHDLTAMANEVSRVIYSRARAAGRLHVEQIVAMYEHQRQAIATIDYALSRRRGRQKLLLLDMDGAVTPSTFTQELAKATGAEAALQTVLNESTANRDTQQAHVATLFKFIHRQQFERVALGLAIRPGLIACVNRLRRDGFMVGVLSSNYFVAAEILRKRIFADFALANTIQFEGDVCTGELRVNPAFLPTRKSGHDEAASAVPSLGHVLRYFREDSSQPAVDEIWVVTHDAHDMPLLQAADRAFLINRPGLELPGLPQLSALAGYDTLGLPVAQSLAEA
jgi:glucosyl-3-phosphoglycerate synthase